VAGKKPKKCVRIFKNDFPSASNQSGMMGGLSCLFFGFDANRRTKKERPRGGFVTEKLKKLLARRA
jgi:hypothetical protein